MIIPLRPFSITDIDFDGFDEGAEYPVLAIDVRETSVQENESQTDEDQLDEAIKEDSEVEEDEIDNYQNSNVVRMAYFLVVDNYNEFVWVAENECKFYQTIR